MVLGDSSLHVGDCVHRVGEFETGKIVFVEDGYALVDFSIHRKFKTAYLPLPILERAPSGDSMSDGPFTGAD